MLTAYRAMRLKLSILAIGRSRVRLSRTVIWVPKVNYLCDSFPSVGNGSQKFAHGFCALFRPVHIIAEPGLVVPPPRLVAVDPIVEPGPRDVDVLTFFFRIR